MSNRSRSAQRRLVESPELISTRVSVVSVAPLTPTFRRVVLAGDGLTGYRATPGDAFRLMIPRPEDRHAIMASFDERGFPYWPDGTPRPTLRTYAVRSADASAGTLTLDVGRFAAGPHWLDRVEPGDSFHVVGMRHGFLLPTGTTSVALVADASALPAAAAILEALPPAVRATVCAEVPVPGDRALLPERPATTVHWTVGTLSRGGASPLERLARTHLPDGAGVASRVAAEAGVAAALRAWLLDDRGVDPASTVTIAHWQHGLTSDERDARLLPRFEDANRAGFDLRDLDVLERLDLGLPLPPNR